MYEMCVYVKLNCIFFLYFVYVMFISIKNISHSRFFIKYKLESAHWSKKTDNCKGIIW